VRGSVAPSSGPVAASTHSVLSDRPGVPVGCQIVDDSGQQLQFTGRLHSFGEAMGCASIASVPKHGVDGATHGGGTGRFGVEASADAGPCDAGGDLRLVLVAAGRDDRHAVAQRVLDAAVPAVC